jgi:hypothetical protein
MEKLRVLLKLNYGLTPALFALFTIFVIRSTHASRNSSCLELFTFNCTDWSRQYLTKAFIKTSALISCLSLLFILISFAE